VGERRIRSPCVTGSGAYLALVHDASAARADAGCGIRSNQIMLSLMKTLSVTDVARNFSAVLDGLERDREEIVLVRNRRPIARLVPEAPRQDALSVFGDLYRVLDDDTAAALSAAIASSRKNRRGRVSQLRDPWAG
jgi:antitoxin (DNA-binding transcriptional repressor) of toxin-antitoxin stability system